LDRHSSRADCAAKSSSPLVGPSEPSASAPIQATLPPAHEEKEGRKNQINQDNQKYGNHHGPRRRPSHLLGSCSREEPFVAADRSDGDAEHQAFDQSRHDIAQKERIERRLNVTRSEEHTSELQSPDHLVCRLLLEKKKESHQDTV